MVKGYIKKDSQINTNKENIKEQIDKVSSFFIPEEHNLLTLELIDRRFIREKDIQIFCYDQLFEQLLQDGIQ